MAIMEITVKKIDSQNPVFAELRDNFAARALPTILCFKKGIFVAKIGGGRSKAIFTNIFQQLIDLPVDNLELAHQLVFTPKRLINPFPR